MKNEEAIAEALADYQTRGKEALKGMKPKVRAALDRILRFFKRTANGLRGRGFKTWEDIFEGDIASGAAGQRADAAAGKPSRAEFDRQLQAAWHGSRRTSSTSSAPRPSGRARGNQMFGYGLYFAENREIAEHYRNVLGSRSLTPSTMKVTGQGVSRKRPSMHDALLRTGWNIDAAQLDKQAKPFGEARTAVLEVHGPGRFDGDP